MTKNINLVKYSRRFEKQIKKAPLEVKITFLKRRKLFLKNHFHPLLNNHILTGEYSGKRSINITGDWRAIYSETKDTKGQTIIIFEVLGTHSQLYK